MNGLTISRLNSADVEAPPKGEKVFMVYLKESGGSYWSVSVGFEPTHFFQGKRRKWKPYITIQSGQTLDGISPAEQTKNGAKGE